MPQQPNSNGQDNMSEVPMSDSMAIVIEAIQLSNNLADNLVEAGNEFRKVLGLDGDSMENISIEHINQHLPAYEKKIGQHHDDIVRLTEILPVADDVALATVKNRIPPEVTLLSVLNGELIPGIEIVGEIADWSASIDDDLDALYAESLFADFLAFHPEIAATEAGAIYEKLVVLLEASADGRENVNRLLEYFDLPDNETT